MNFDRSSSACKEQVRKMAGPFFGNGVMTYGGEFGDESRPIHLRLIRLDHNEWVKEWWKNNLFDLEEEIAEW